MSQVHTLDKVIQKVDAATKANSSNEKIITIDSRSKEVISGWKRLVTGNLAYYLVANTNDAANSTECKGLICQLKDFVNDREVTISINYQASCQPGNEEKVAQSLCGDNKPGEQLAEKIQSYIDKFSRSKAADFINNYSINKLKELQNFVQDEVTQEVGLNFDLRLSLANEEYLKPFPTGFIQFPVHVRDCTDDLDLQMQIELIVIDEQSKVKALANYGREVLLVNLVEEEVKKYLLENITLHKFCYELKTTVSNEIFAYLNKSQSLINKGRKVRFLSLASNSVSSLPEEIVEIQYDVECKYQGYPEPKPILVKNTIQMLLNNIGKYRLAQSPNLEAWVRSKLERIVKPLLLYKEYIDILLDFEPIALQIRAAMEEAATPLGYEVKHIVSRPNLKIIEVIKGFNIEIEESNLATKDPNVKVKVSTFVAGKIENPREIKDYLSQDVDLEGLIKQTIHNAVREVLHSIEPERYYLRFYFPAEDERGNPIEKSVEQELTEKIKEVLEQSFYAKISTIIPKPLNTEITERYQELYEKIGSFEFEVPSLNGDEAPVEFEGDFQVQGVEKNSWYIFQSRLPRINDIKQSIEKSLKAKLNTLDDEILQYRDTENLLLLEDFINQWINNPVGRGSIANQFGLEISIGNLSRSRTAIEESRSKVSQEMQHIELDDAFAHLTARKNQLAAQKQIAAQGHEAISLELSKLYEQRARILALPDNEDELEELNTKINDLVKEIPTPTVEEAKKKLNLLKREKPKSKSLSEVTQQITRLTDKNNPAITSGSDTKILGEDKKDRE